MSMIAVNFHGALNELGNELNFPLATQLQLCGYKFAFPTMYFGCLFAGYVKYVTQLVHIKTYLPM